MKEPLLVLAFAAAVSMDASAATQGSISFQGSVINATSQVATASDYQLITLPQLPSDTFTTKSEMDGAQIQFQITLSGYKASTPGTVAVGFDFISTNTDHNIISNTGTATGVGLQLHDEQNKVIVADSNNYLSTPVALPNGDVVFNLSVNYVSTAATVTSGSVIASSILFIRYS